MSSGEDNDERIGSKRRRVARACDTCRRRKCDAAEMPNNRCTTCVTSKLECTYYQPTKRRDPTKDYVASLEQRLQRMEGLLKELRPDEDFSEDAMLPVVTGTRRHRASPGSSPSTSSSSQPTPASSVPSPESLITDNNEGPDSSDEELPNGTNLASMIEQLRLNPALPRFNGKSSAASMMQEMGMKPNLDSDVVAATLPDGRPLNKRPDYWTLQAYEQQALVAGASTKNCLEFDFPEPDLQPLLIDAYYTSTNQYLQVVHRPTFERSLAEGLHYRDEGFAKLLLIVCAIGGAFVDDPRVFNDSSPQSAGWKWFNQVQITQRSLLAAPTLYDVQVYCLATIFLQACSVPQAYWTLLGTGIRLAQDVGAHRKKMYAGKKSVHNEQWKRTFWAMITIDRCVSWLMGRPSAMQDEDMDIDLPLEVDDEYWEHPDPALAFQQPAGKPSKVTSFVQTIKLYQILSFALRTIYSIKRSKVLLGFIGPDWEQKTVAQLNSALNKWHDSVPDHLRWDPRRTDETFFDQSAYLYSAYYLLLITVHRPFVPSEGKENAMAVPALLICTNAARSCARVIDAHAKRRNGQVPTQIAAAFQCGMVLLLNIRGEKRPGVTFNASKEMEDVQKCMDLLKACETRWPIAGRFWDTLSGLASVNGAPPVDDKPALDFEGRFDAGADPNGFSMDSGDSAILAHFALDDTAAFGPAQDMSTMVPMLETMYHPQYQAQALAQAQSLAQEQPTAWGGAPPQHPASGLDPALDFFAYTSLPTNPDDPMSNFSWLQSPDLDAYLQPQQPQQVQQPHHTMPSETGVYEGDWNASQPAPVARGFYGPAPGDPSHLVNYNRNSMSNPGAGYAGVSSAIDITSDEWDAYFAQINPAAGYNNGKWPSTGATQ